MVETNSTDTKDAAPTVPYASLASLMEAHSDLLQSKPETSGDSTYFKDVQTFFDRARATGALLDDDNDIERQTAQSILNYWVTVLYRSEVGKPDNTTLAEYDPQSALQQKSTESPNPYPGVRAFREDENRLFFGRQRQINYMLGRLREDRLLAVVGPSGSGKTSLVLAGLLPEMKKNDKANNIERHFFDVITPDSRPLENLERMFQSSSDTPLAEDSSEQTAGFQQDPDHLLNRIKQFTQLPAVIVVDQFEEVFTRANEPDRHAFITNLARVIRERDAKHIVILTMRDDNYDSYLRRPERFRNALDPAKVSLPQLGSLELREAIEKPAAYVGLKFEEPTIKDLVRDTISEPVGLPLLQFTLFKLWTRHEQKEDINEAFNETRSCRTVLKNSAEEFFKKLDLFDQVSCFRLLSQLVKIDGDLKPYTYPVRRADLYLRTELNSRVDSLIERLAQQQLIRLSPGSMPADDEVELVHDSLLRTWPRMASLVETKKRALRLYGVAKVVGTAAAIALLVLIVLFLVGRQQQSSKSRELARLSNKQFTYDRFDLALLLGREAFTLEDNSATRSNSLRLLHALQSASHPRAFLSRENFKTESKKRFEAQDVVFSAENDRAPARLAAIYDEGNIVIWNVNPPAMEKSFVAKNATLPLAFSPDGQTLATASVDSGSVILWNVVSGEEIKHLTQDKKPFQITSLVFSPDGKTLITGNLLGSVVEWDLANESARDLYQHSAATLARVNHIAFHATRNLLASGSEDGTVILYDLRAKDGRRRTFAAGGEVKHRTSKGSFKTIKSVAFSPESELLAAGSYDEAFIWNLVSGEHLEIGADPRSSGIIVSFTADGGLLACFSFDSGIFLYDVSNGRLVTRQFYRPAPTQSAAFSYDGKLLALPSEDGVSVWNVFNERMLTAEGKINSIAFSPSDKIIASGGDDSTLTLWKTPNPDEYEVVGHPIKESAAISTLAFSEDGKLLAAGLKNGKISLRNPQDNKKLRELDVHTGSVVKADSPDLADVAESQAEAAETESAIPTPSYSVSKAVFDPQPNSYRLAAVVKGQEEGPKGESEEYLGSRIIIWDTDKEASTDLPEVGRVTSLAFSSYASTLAWGSTDEKIRASDSNAKGKFRVILRKTQNTETHDLPSEDEASSLAFSKDGKTLAAGLANGKIVLWNITTRLQIGRPLLGSSGEVTDLVFSPNGKTLAAVINKRPLQLPRPGVIMLWDVDTGEQIGNSLFGHDGSISTIAFSRDGKILASGSRDDSNIVLWDLDVAGSNKRFCSIVDCRGELPEPAAELRKKSFFQKVYTKVLSWLGESPSQVSASVGTAH